MAKPITTAFGRLKAKKVHTELELSVLYGGTLVDGEKAAFELEDLYRRLREAIDSNLALRGEIAKIRPLWSAAVDENVTLQKLLDCRAGKLLRMGKFFVVVTKDEPYFKMVYDTIKEHEHEKGTWTLDDEKMYLEAVLNDE